MRYYFLATFSLIVIGMCFMTFAMSLFLMWWPGLAAEIEPLPVFFKNYPWVLQITMIGVSSLLLILMLSIYAWAYERLPKQYPEKY